MEAALEAARLRLRPILMTSMAFILGVLPLAVSNGAGSGSQHAIGTAVIGGMIAATFLATFLSPMFFVVVRGRFSHKVPLQPAAQPAAELAAPGSQQDTGGIPLGGDSGAEGHRP